jgi:copper(I)-binding protein
MIVGVAVQILAAQEKTVQASSGWVKLPAAGETMASAFVVVDNPTQYDVYLVSGATDAAERVEFREKADEQAKKTINVPAFDSLAMDANGVYLRLVNLKRPLKEGDTISLALTTDSSAVLKVSATVRKE